MIVLRLKRNPRSFLIKNIKLVFEKSLGAILGAFRCKLGDIFYAKPSGHTGRSWR
jgi:hypothetical protein